MDCVDSTDHLELVHVLRKRPIASHLHVFSVLFTHIVFIERQLLLLQYQ